MTQVRKPAVAGMFYPDDPAVLKQQVDRLLAKASDHQYDTHTRAIVAPHAGYIYSGDVAANAYKGLESIKQRISRVVLLGPSHRVGFYGLALCSADAYETPLGNIALDKESAEALAKSGDAFFMEQAHLHEHSLEVQLPFLQAMLGDFVLLPIVAGETSTADVAKVIERFWNDDATLIVISSDLSHYHDYATAQQMDKHTCEAIESLDYEQIGYDDACGRIPLSGLLYAARAHGGEVTTLGMKNSGDTSGDKSRVVGYGAWVIETPHTPAP